MVKSFISIILVSTILFPTLVKVYILVDFGINRDIITKVLCIEKDISDSTCKGKCYLNKQLRKTENETNDEFPYLIKTDTEPIQFFEDFKDFPGVLVMYVNPLHFLDYKLSNYSQYTNSIFHPPRSSS